VEQNDLVTVYTETDPNRGEIIKGALQAEGIPCELGGGGQAGFTGLWEIDVMVRAEDADRARQIIESHE
jgi:hypothetical protein